jgi:hypothetical protein
MKVSSLFIKIEQDMIFNPKVKKLSRELNIDEVKTRGVLVTLWIYVYKFALDGDITNWDNSMLTDMVGIDKENLIDIFVEARFVDKIGNRYLIHDWLEIAGAYLQRKFASRKEKLAEIYKLHGRELRDYHKHEGQAESTSAPHSEVKRTPPPSDLCGKLALKMQSLYTTNSVDSCRKEIGALLKDKIPANFIEAEVCDMRTRSSSMKAWEICKDIRKLWEIRRRTETDRANGVCPRCAGKGWLETKPEDRVKTYLKPEFINEAYLNMVKPEKDNVGYFTYEPKVCDKCEGSGVYKK